VTARFTSIDLDSDEGEYVLASETEYGRDKSAPGTLAPCIHCGQPTEFKIWRWYSVSHHGEFVFDCGCKFAQVKS
jgi:hypothetical protein